MLYIEKLQQQIDEQLVELANLREQLSQEKILNQNQETYLNLLEKEVEDLIKTLKGKPRKKGQHGDNR
jgi:nucleotidyltransferase/DNA polymerase involved in DNA repair